jgi:hypothetical protein
MGKTRPMTTARRCTRFAVATAALTSCLVTPCRGENALVITSASLERRSAPNGHATGHYEADVEFAEAHLEALRDDEAVVEMRVLDRDEHGGRHMLEDLEDCRFTPDGSMACPGGLLFRRVAGDPPRWRLAITFSSRSAPDAFRGPVTVRLAYSVSGGPETVHVGTIASCVPAHEGPTLTCRATRKTERRRHAAVRACPWVLSGTPGGSAAPA